MHSRPIFSRFVIEIFIFSGLCMSAAYLVHQASDASESEPGRIVDHLPTEGVKPLTARNDLRRDPAVSPVYFQSTPAPAGAGPTASPTATPQKRFGEPTVAAFKDITATHPHKAGVAVTNTRSKITVTGALGRDQNTGNSEVLVRANLLGLLEPTVQATATITGQTWSAELELKNDGLYGVTAQAKPKNTNDFQESFESADKKIEIRRTGPVVIDANVFSLQTGLPPFTIPVQFAPQNPLVAAGANTASNYTLKRTDKAGLSENPADNAAFNPTDNVVTLTFNTIDPGTYELKVKATNSANALADIFGNALGVTAAGGAATDFVKGLLRPVGTSVPTVTPGIAATTGPYVPFPEFTDPRPRNFGFNPSDKVETRVVRLYYYRDAHRVAQIVNREVKSYNRAAVDMHRQLADQARQLAANATTARQVQESKAIAVAQETRVIETRLDQAQTGLQSAVAEQQRLQLQLLAADAAGDATKKAAVEAQIKNVDTIVGNFRRDVDQLATEVEVKRRSERDASELFAKLQREEDLAVEEQFRREVAAGHADPDTYAPGDPKSIDPVRQVSISVIGEGVIQLRGPIKGINIIRTMINEIDSPVGQVRVAIHTVQINGEREERMEKVAERIQFFIDHSRFLTTQSAEMLRKSVVKVAAQRAVEVSELYPGCTQADRDMRYMYAFFGQDFIHELAVMDSEFLKSGNKLLSLHSMHSTSLASALFLFALANNNTRNEILIEFQRQCNEELPRAEEQYIQAGMHCDCRSKKGCCHKEMLPILAMNARFQSITGFFDAEVQGVDTMTPVQREFIRLAQIFKSRLITELEYKQRVMERGLIEERVVLNEAEKQLEALEKEDAAHRKLAESRIAGAKARALAVSSVQRLLGLATTISQESANYSKQMDAYLDSIIPTVRQSVRIDPSIANSPEVAAAIHEVARRAFAEAREDNPDALFTAMDTERKNLVRQFPGKIGVKDGIIESPQIGMRAPDIKINLAASDTKEKITFSPDLRLQILALISQSLADNQHFADFIKEIKLAPLHEERRTRLTAIAVKVQQTYDKFKDRAPTDDDDVELANSIALAYRMTWLQWTIATHVRDELGSYVEIAKQISKEIDQSEQVDAAKILGDVGYIRGNVGEYLVGGLRASITKELDALDQSVQSLGTAKAEERAAREIAELSRHDLDHKKFLDMLIDDLEEKYIELLEGTRAHTATIDDYVKRLATALDDDFNTQFYHPAFREIRRASAYWDVSMGQVETTSILANNRAFGKVSPQATMEFDLPKREIMIQEAMAGAKAAIDTYGALVNDPSFLALTQMGSGQPTSTPIGGAAGGFGSVRNVLPGLPSATAEEVLSQHGPGDPQLGAPLEALIPDPAVYKFETGTGYEIRPVIQPDGQAVVFHFNYMYTTNVREPVRADEKHLGRVKRHFIDTDVQTSNYELREVSRYTVALKAARTAKGVPLLQDLPGLGVLFRPLPSAESSLQQNVILAQSVIFPTLFDLMGLRWAPVVADLDPLRLSNEEFLVRNRRRFLSDQVYDRSSQSVDEFLRVPEQERRADLYRTQETIPHMHPNGYQGPGLNYRDSTLREGFDPNAGGPAGQPGPMGMPPAGQGFYPGEHPEGSPYLVRPQFPNSPYQGGGYVAPHAAQPGQPMQPGGPMPNPNCPPIIPQLQQQQLQQQQQQPTQRGPTLEESLPVHEPVQIRPVAPMNHQTPIGPGNELPSAVRFRSTQLQSTGTEGPSLIPLGENPADRPLRQPPVPTSDELPSPNGSASPTSIYPIEQMQYVQPMPASSGYPSATGSPSTYRPTASTYLPPSPGVYSGTAYPPTVNAQNGYSAPAYAAPAQAPTGYAPTTYTPTTYAPQAYAPSSRAPGTYAPAPQYPAYSQPQSSGAPQFGAPNLLPR
jgi:hypothetical protein